MKILKRLFVGSIILLMLTTPLFVTAGVNEKNQVSSLNINGVNSLGSFNITHQPMLYGYREYKGMIVKDYKKPDGNPDYVYEFPENEDGEVFMNFSLTITHWLNDVPMPYFAEWIFPQNFRYTWLNNLYVTFDGFDYISYNHKEKCTYVKTEYTIWNESKEPLKTNGGNITVKFIPFGGPAVTPLKIIHELTSVLTDVIRNLFENEIFDLIYLTIVPT